MNRPRGKTCILRYRTVWPIILPLQFPSRLYNTSLSGSFSLSPYTINIHLPSFPIIFFSALLFTISFSRLPTFRILSQPITYPLPSYYFQRFQGYQDPRVCLPLYQDTTNPGRPVLFYRQLQTRRSDPGLPLTEEYFFRLSVPNPLFLGLPGPP